MIKTVAICLIFLSTINSCPMEQKSIPTPNDPIYSMTIIAPESGFTTNGRVEMVEVNGVTNIKATIYNLDPGSHGIHIHEFGNLIQGCTSAGGHYNPDGNVHAGPNDLIRHVGDLGNIVQVQGSTEATLTLTSTYIRLQGPKSVIGRSYVVHKDEDDLGRGGFPDSKTTGHAGARVGCGVIGLSGPFDLWFNIEEFSQVANKINLNKEE